MTMRKIFFVLVALTLCLALPTAALAAEGLSGFVGYWKVIKSENITQNAITDTASEYYAEIKNQGNDNLSFGYHIFYDDDQSFIRSFHTISNNVEITSSTPTKIQIRMSSIVRVIASDGRQLGDGGEGPVIVSELELVDSNTFIRTMTRTNGDVVRHTFQRVSQIRKE